MMDLLFLTLMSVTLTGLYIEDKTPMGESVDGSGRAFVFF